MRWHYAGRGGLVVSNGDLTPPTLMILRGMIKLGLIPHEVSEIIFETPATVFVIRGRYLRGWLDGCMDD